MKLAMVGVLVSAVLLIGCDKKDGHEGSKVSEAPGLPKGVGPIQDLVLSDLDESLAAQGEKLFSGTCAACHKMDKRYVGPALAGVTVRRSPEWIMNMIMNPAEMTQKDETAKALLGEYMVQMSVNATEADARALLEYFRKQDQQTGGKKE